MPEILDLSGFPAFLFFTKEQFILLKTMSFYALCNTKCNTKILVFTGLFRYHATQNSRILLIRRFEVTVDEICELPLLVIQLSTVNFFQNPVGAPAAAGHNVNIRNADSVHDGCCVMSEIVKTKVRESGETQRAVKTITNLIRCPFYQSSLDALDSVNYELWVFNFTKTGISLWLLYAPCLIWIMDH